MVEQAGNHAPVGRVDIDTWVWLQMDAIAVPNNTLVVAYNDSPSKRSPLRLGTSTDGGLTWTKGALIEDDPEGSFHYPALLYDAKKVGTTPSKSVSLVCAVCASWHCWVRTGAGKKGSVAILVCPLHASLHPSSAAHISAPTLLTAAGSWTLYGLHTERCCLPFNAPNL